MSEVENMSENACPQNSKPGTENHKTHDVKPKTLNPKPETLLPPKSNFRKYCVLRPESCLKEIGLQQATKEPAKSPMP